MLSVPGALLAAGLTGAIRASSAAADSHAIGTSSGSRESVFLTATRGSFQIQAYIRSDCLGVRSLTGATYVHDLYVFLDCTADIQERIPTPCIVYLEPLRRKVGESDRVST